MEIWKRIKLFTVETDDENRRHSAKTVQEHGSPELQKAVYAGEISPSRAAYATKSGKLKMSDECRAELEAALVAAIRATKATEPGRSQRHCSPAQQECRDTRLRR